MTEIERTIELYREDLPENATLSIEEYDTKCNNRYLFRLQYISKASGRNICITAKGDTLPSTKDSLYHFYLRQIVIDTKELLREFSRVYFLERRARQQAFLSGESGNIRVSGKTVVVGETDGAEDEDKLNFEGYA